MLDQYMLDKMNKKELKTYISNLLNVSKAYDNLVNAFANENEAILSFRNSEQDRLNAAKELEGVFKDISAFEEDIATAYGPDESVDETEGEKDE